MIMRSLDDVEGSGLQKGSWGIPYQHLCDTFQNYCKSIHPNHALHSYHSIESIRLLFDPPTQDSAISVSSDQKGELSWHGFMTH